MRAVNEAESSHLWNLGEFDGLNRGSRQREVEEQDLSVELGGDRRGQARRVGLGNARCAHALDRGIAQGNDQVRSVSLGMFLELAQPLEGGQVVVLPGLAVVAALGVQSQEAPDGKATTEEARAARGRSRHLPCSFADPHRSVLPSFVLRT